MPTPGHATGAGTVGDVEEELAVQCSAKRCREAALWELRWNNPKLHSDAYRKIWLACELHRETLGEFLGARGFLREVTAFRPTA
ncbi:hypothetical protein Ahu01nite_002840 [Winogradskya humida]|uniref:Acetone carboxylase n=1 Tax=Winogradskya humida TaxID=113566 RepID=A0ABQ3ZFZ0_9ACTN|nr:hypothetical protein Ahu01nite_002840 [Actinoplanes humidus]